jgi:hypothetical protein
MAGATIEVSGPDAEHQAGELQAALVMEAESGGRVSPVEVERSPEFVVAIVGLVFSGVGAAKTIWDWWQSRRADGLTVRILLDDGSTVELSNVDAQHLQLEFERRTKPSSDVEGVS